MNKQDRDYSETIEFPSNWIATHDDVIKWKHFLRYWPFVRGIHRPPVNSPHKGQWRRALMFSLICAWINDWVNNREAGDLRRHRAHYDVTVMGKVIGEVGPSSPFRHWSGTRCLWGRWWSTRYGRSSHGRRRLPELYLWGSHLRDWRGPRTSRPRKTRNESLDIITRDITVLT